MSDTRKPAPSIAALVRRAALITAGSVLCAVGIVLLVLPGPGLLLIAAGLSLLATELVWARRAVLKAKARVRLERMRRRRRRAG